MTFIHVHVHSDFSLGRGTIPIQKLVKLALDNKMPALALTDTNALYGILDFSIYCASKGIQPILGAEICIENSYYPVLVKNETGFRNLLELMIYPDRITLESLKERSSGLFFLTGGWRGGVYKALQIGKYERAKETIGHFLEIFSQNFGIEIIRFGLEYEEQINDAIIELSEEFAQPLVAANDVHFAKQDDFLLHEVILSIGQGKVLAHYDRERGFKEAWFKSQDQMKELFSDLPDAIENTALLARKCAFMMEKRKPVIPSIGDHKELEKQAFEGLQKRFGNPPKEYVERLSYELDIIKSMGYSGYFLVVSDFIRWAKRNGIPVGPGRGSGAGSLVAYCIEITDINPLRFNLLFERFLNPERVSMPDIDVDFCQEKRDKVIEYVSVKYGHDCVSYISTFSKFHTRGAVRDVGRVMGLPYSQVDKLAKQIPSNADKIQLQVEDEELQQVISVSQKIEGIHRHRGLHAAGIIIADKPVINYVPVIRDSGVLATQFEMKAAESAGLVKFDFLGLTALTTIRYAKEIIGDNLENIPLDDEKTFELLRSGDTLGVFQFESIGMKDVIQRMEADCIEDLIAAVALYRPGPMSNIPAYCEGKKTGKWKPIHPKVRDILAETYGIIVYQEQVMQIAQRLAGYSLGAADILRRAMGKKIKAEMDAQREVFVSGCAKNGISKSEAQHIFDTIAHFADYGFNKSHAAAYAYMSYITAYIKAHYPIAFYAASMSTEIGNEEKVGALVYEAKNKGIKILPPCIQKSQFHFTVENQSIRCGLGAVKGVGKVIMNILEQRPKEGFPTIYHAAQKLSKNYMEALVKAGAFDAFNKNRSELYHNAKIIIATKPRDDLFGGTHKQTKLKPKTPWDKWETMEKEAEVLGFYIDRHPLDKYRRILQYIEVTYFNDVNKKPKPSKAMLIGTIISTNDTLSKKGTPLKWVKLNDTKSTYEVCLFSDVWVENKEILQKGQNVLLYCHIREQEGQTRVNVQRVYSLDRIIHQIPKTVTFSIHSESEIEELKSKIESFPDGHDKIMVKVVSDECEYLIELPFKKSIPIDAEQIATTD